MDQNLKVIALISGGKDSVYSMLHCLSHGHEIVALANLHPEQAQYGHVDDIESYMYQTIGYSVIPLYQQAFDTPLYREPIRGYAANTSKSYQFTASDETECLLSLLTRVLKDHPDANAVSSGAILSTYQRSRVESVALRLNLIPLAYLWQYPALPPYVQSSLLQDMHDAQLDARLVKVASGGLEADVLWENVSDHKTIAKLERAVARFRGNTGLAAEDGRSDGAVLGEGGEFETLAIDGPRGLFKQKISVAKEDIEVVADSGGTAFLRISNACCVDKDGDLPDENDDAANATTLRNVKIPVLWDDEFTTILDSWKSNNFIQSLPKELKDSDFKDRGLEPDRDASSSEKLVRAEIIPNTPKKKDGTMYISNIFAENSTVTGDAIETDSIVLQIEHLLSLRQLSSENISSTTILLRSMASFAVVNKNYSKMFTKPNPPARVTIALGDRMPAGVNVMMSFVVENKRDEMQRTGLHVQSRSYWAPANIGPYSQAITVPLSESTASIVHVAGQIPLIPSTMEMLDATDFREHALLSLQHLWRIGRETGVRWWAGGTVCYITARSETEAQERAVISGQAWKLIHDTKTDAEGGSDEENEEFDVADVALYRPWATVHDSNPSQNTTGKSERTYRGHLPDWNCVSKHNNGPVSEHSSSISPTCIIAEVAELPRGAVVEWTSFGFAGEILALELQSYERISAAKTGEFDVRWIQMTTEQELLDFLQLYSTRLQRSSSLTEIFTASPRPSYFTMGSNTMIIPCHGVWSSNGEKLFAALRWRGHNDD